MSLITLLVLLFTNERLAAQVSTAWIQRYDGTGGGDVGQAVAVDNAGNVYVTGYSEYNTGGTGDDYDYKTVKYGPSGTQLWVRTYDNPGEDDQAQAIAVDGAGNVYVTGHSVGAGSGPDYATVKYNSSGTQQWIVRYNGPGNNSDYAEEIAVDASGNVYITGNSGGSGTNTDYTTVKYNSAGVQQWVKRYNGVGSGYDAARALALSGNGAYLYVTGNSQYISGSDNDTDYITIKYNTSDGAVLWTSRFDGAYNGDDGATDIAANGTGIYVTGSSKGADADDYSDYVTIKYDGNGVQQWAKRYNDASNGYDYPNAIAIDGAGNAYVTGYGLGSGSVYNYQFVTIKYTSSGTQQWLKTYNGYGNEGDQGKDVAVDGGGNVYVTGSSTTSDASTTNYSTVKYNSAGTQQWARNYNGYDDGYDQANDLAVDNSGNVYVTGYSESTSTSSDYLTIKYSQTLTTLRINCGGPDVNTGGLFFASDRNYSGTSEARSFPDAGDIAGTTNDVVFKTFRSGTTFSYNIPVVNGSYQVRLNFAELYFTAANQRKFSVNLEGGATELSNFDIFAAAGGAKKAINKAYTIVVTDGVLNIAFTSSVSKAMINVIQVFPTSAARVGAEPLAEATEEPTGGLTAFPSPFTHQLTLQVGQSSGKAVVTVADMLGRSLYQQRHQPQGGQVTLNLPQLKAGVYVVRVQTDSGTSRTLRVVKQ